MPKRHSKVESGSSVSVFRQANELGHAHEFAILHHVVQNVVIPSSTHAPSVPQSSWLEQSPVELPWHWCVARLHTSPAPALQCASCVHWPIAQVRGLALLQYA